MILSITQRTLIDPDSVGAASDCGAESSHFAETKLVVWLKFMATVVNQPAKTQ